MGQDLVVPDSFKKMGAPAKAFQSLNAADDNLAEGIGQSYGIVGYKGKVWSLRYRGERHNIIRPDDGTPSAYIDVIILGQAKQKSKSYYGAYDPDAAGERPICSSIDGVTPDTDVTEKQCDTCALCPRNEWKAGPNGKKGKECSDYKRLAVLILPTQTKPILGAPLMEPVFLRVPAGSLNSLAILGDTMAGQGFHFSTYITRISFDPNEAHPKMVFAPLQGLTDKEAPIVLQLRADPTCSRITTGDLVMKQVGTNTPPTALPAAGAETGIAAAAAPTKPSTTAPKAKTKATPSTSAAVASAQPATNTGLSGLSPAPTAASISLEETIAVATSQPLTEAADEPFGGAMTAGPVAPSQNTVADTGAAEESDADLDARIAGLIQTQ